jgi:hypothetical protein
MKWAGASSTNGSLLRAAEALFDVLITTDKNLRLSAEFEQPDSGNSGVAHNKLA